MDTSYQDFLMSKRIAHKPCGIDIDSESLNKNLFDWQRVVVKWALYKGRSALFEDAGLGKTIQFLSWASAVHDETCGDIIIFSPLAVSHQTIREGIKFGVPVTYCKSKDDVMPGINITNYERIDNFDPSAFIGVVLDESSIIKSFTGKFRNELIERYESTPYKLACSATPAPNDYTELGNTAEFLGVMSRSEMLSMFFINDTSDTTASWRLKGHVKNNVFWDWLASWAVVMRRPSDIGFSDDGYILPDINYVEHVIPYSGTRDTLFVEQAEGLSGVRESMRETLVDRVKKCAEIANGNDKVWAVWCNLNDESSALTAAIDGAVEVKGSDKPEYKEKTLLAFSDDTIRAIITKPKLAMFGMNWQNCYNVIITGLSHSYEQFYQLIRRFHRFGQKNTVNVHIVYGEREGNVLNTVLEKERRASDMFESMIVHMRSIMKDELTVTDRKTTLYNPKTEMQLPKFIIEGVIND